MESKDSSLIYYLLSSMIKISDVYDDNDRTIEVFGLKFHWPFPIAFMLHSSGATVFGYRAYGGKEKRPVVNRVRRIFEAISNFKYALMYRFCKRHQYHVIYTDLGYGYHCSDDRILYGAMKCLEDYVEAGKHGGESGLEEGVKELRTSPDPNAPDGLCDNQANREEEALKIYRWWKYEKPADEKRRQELLMRVYGRDGDSIEWKPTDHPQLTEMVFKEAPGEFKKALRDQFRALEQKIDEDEQSYLHRLIEIRQSLWI